MKNYHRDIHCRSRATTIIPACCALLLLAVFFSVAAGDSGGKEAFAKGRKDLDAGRYSDAVSSLILAQKEFTLLEDYTMIYLAEAYHNLGEHEKSQETLRALIDKYPSSPLRKKARMAEIREEKDISNEGQLPLYKAYVRDFPEDDEAYYIYGRLLKDNRQNDKASEVFRRLYIRAGYLSAAAQSELSADEITTADITERASNLIKQYDFEEAERNLKQALALCSGKNRHEILKTLAYALFKQKKYREATELYGELNDLFYKARCLYRSGDKKSFETTLSALMDRNDKKAGFLLITVAADRRREKDFDRAIQIYQDVLKNYTSDAEDALWGIGWTQYLSGDYQKSEETFSQLHAKYNDAKYLYWQARSVEALNKDALPLYTRLIAADNNNFYAVLSYARSRRMIPRLTSLNMQIDRASEKSRTGERVEALISLDMRAEAVAELAASGRNTSSLPDLMYTAAKFQELGEFKRSISLTTKLPYSEKLHRFWYPLAFWDTVEQASKRNNIDPLIILSVMREESRFDQTVKSPAGAYGLMQLMPQTAYRLDRSLNLGIRRPSQLTDPKNNVQLGSFYLRSLLNEFHSLAHMLAAYNAGELAVRSWQRFDYRSIDEFIEDIPYNETRNYVKKVLTSYFQYKRAAIPEQGEDSGIEIILGKTL